MGTADTIELVQSESSFYKKLFLSSLLYYITKVAFFFPNEINLFIYFASKITY